MTLADLKVDYETPKGQFIKWTTYGELVMGLESHQGSKSWSNRQIFCDRNKKRPCIYSMFDFCESLVSPKCHFPCQDDPHPQSLKLAFRRTGGHPEKPVEKFPGG